MSDTVTKTKDLGRTVQERGVKGLKTVAGALNRIERFFSEGDVQVLHTVVRRPDGDFSPVVFLTRDELYLASSLANAGVFVLGLA